MDKRIEAFKRHLINHANGSYENLTDSQRAVIDFAADRYIELALEVFTPLAVHHLSDKLKPLFIDYLSYSPSVPREQLFSTLVGALAIIDVAFYMAQARPAAPDDDGKVVSLF